MSGGLTVVALGGNALSPPAGDPSLAAERALLERTAGEIAAMATDGGRLLVVHGNGPQVGRLLALDPDTSQLDVRVAQTQGELGYLLAEALERRLGTPCAALVTRVLVDADDPAFGTPSKPVGDVLAVRPPGVAAVRTPDGRGWRRAVASPRPTAVLEREAIGVLLGHGHVVAGGGGGVPLAAGARHPLPAVVDKDFVAALLAIALDAERLVFVTDVPCAFDDFHSERVPIRTMTVAEARARLGREVFAPGSMAPKVESAVDFVAATGRRAVIAMPGALAAALREAAGTVVAPERAS